MIHREYGNVYFSCDHCADETFEPDPPTQSFEAAWSAARRAGWEAERKLSALDWDHRCRECAKV